MYRAPIMCLWLNRNESHEAGTASTMTTTTTTPQSSPSSSSATNELIQVLGRDIVISCIGGGLIYWIYHRRRVNQVRRLLGLPPRTSLGDRLTGISSSVVSTALKLGEKVVNLLALAVIIQCRLVPAILVRCAFASKNWYHLTFGRR
ncbi:unnamed protein product [Cylindrotheca closterium]|uniref:Uncharacterized protein n=1 Tax=Cylindrotheca closterium TaxID=2856 RepID=A0AAD2FSI2_9STRA|nr:unnamed protein product [Cylindrotheca closterium]